MRSRKSFKCRHCKEMCCAEARNGWHQRYCSKAECRKASKAMSQRHWLGKPENRDYFRGSENVARVQRWRREHTGYWKGQSSGAGDALQDVLPSEPSQSQEVMKSPLEHALQDVMLLQVPLVVGLLSVLTGSALQDDIAASARQMVAKGQMILGKGPGIELKGDCHDENQASVVSRAVAPTAGSLELGGSSFGARGIP